MKSRSFVRAVLASMGGLTLASSQAFALDNIIRPYQSTRAAGMGGVMYSTGLYEENFFGNPARTSANPKWKVEVLSIMAEANSGTIENGGDLTQGGDTISNVAGTAGTNNHVRVQSVFPAVYVPHFFSENNSFAIGLITSTQGDVDLRKNFSIEPTVVADAGPAISFARKFVNKRLSVGVTGHYMYRLTTNQTFSTSDYIRGVQFSKIKDEAAEGATLDFDLGATYNIPWSPNKWKFQPAFAVNRVMNGKFSKGPIEMNKVTDIRPADLKRTFNFGVSGTRQKVFFFQKVTTAFEVQDIGNNTDGSIFRTLHLGAEAHLIERIAIRAGINQGYFTAGIGFDLPVIDLDFATYGEEMSLNAGGLEDRRYAFRLGIAI